MIVFVWVQLQRLSIQWCSGSTLGERCKVAVGSIVDDVSNYFNTWVVEAFTFDWLCTGASEGSSHELVSQSWAYWLWSGARSNKIDRCLWCLKGHHAQHKTWTSQDKGTLRERCDATTVLLPLRSCTWFQTMLSNSWDDIALTGLLIEKAFTHHFSKM